MSTRSKVLFVTGALAMAGLTILFINSGDQREDRLTAYAALLLMAPFAGCMLWLGLLAAIRLPR